MKTQLKIFLAIWTLSFTIRSINKEIYPSINLEAKALEEEASKVHKKRPAESLIGNNQAVSDLGKRSSECSQQLHTYESEVFNLDTKISDLQAKILSLKSNKENQDKLLNKSINEITAKVTFLKNSHESNSYNHKQTIANFKETLKYIDECLNYISNSSINSSADIENLDILIANLNYLKINIEENITKEYSQSQDDREKKEIIEKLKASLNSISHRDVEIEERKATMNQKFEESLEAMKKLQDQSQSLRETLLSEKEICNKLKDQQLSKIDEKDITINIYYAYPSVFDDSEDVVLPVK
ncbi:unnamed protein product [Blepharisma stoltei]|uniref:Uncharacterized protein n=1 Tax=Blepharisma stoltei TaxID=1481888 RepID=A0AAU9JGM1_9CILI|nr:unnamed protein product [Blepharisma stoltei]